MRDDVVGQFVLEVAHGQFLLADGDFTRLQRELIHRLHTCTAGSLIGSHLNVLDVREVVERLEGYNHDDGRAVGIGDDVAWSVQGVFAVHLGHHQGHIVIHAEGAAVIDHDAAVLGDGGGKLAGWSGSHRYKSNVDVLEVIVVLQEFHHIVLAAERENASGTAFRAEKDEFSHGEILFVEDTHEFLSYCAAGANNSNLHWNIMLKF